MKARWHKMKTFTLFSISSALMIWTPVSTPAQHAFKPAAIAVASDVPFPISSVASGIVVIDVALDTNGEVIGTEVRRDIPSLTSVAKSSALSWKYRPATLDATSIPSVIRVAFAFRPRAVMVAPPTFAPMGPADSAGSDAKSGYIPAGILGVAFPAYPIDAASVGTVVVQAKVDENGSVKALRAIRPFPPFNRFSLEAARKWRFQAATLNGEAIASNLVIAFVFSSPPVAY